MEYTPLPAVTASQVPMRPFHLPNVPVTPLPKIPARPIPSVKVSKTGEHAPKTKPIYGMARPYVACIHGMKGPYVEH